MVGTTVTSKIRMQRFRNLLPQIKFIQIYFSTETGLIAANSHDKYMESCHKPEAIGPLLNSSKVKIIDIESGKLLGPNKYGQLLFNGDGLMLGYFGDKELTIKSMDNGYFKTGDIAEFDKDGWLYVYGRTEDLIHIEKNIFRPNELEDVILLHPLVKNVAAISNGKELIACVVKKPFTNLAPQALLSFLNNRLPEHLQPTRVIIMDNLPITSTGEVKKRKLREKFFGFKIEHRNSLSSVNFNF